MVKRKKWLKNCTICIKSARATKVAHLNAVKETMEDGQAGEEVNPSLTEDDYTHLGREADTPHCPSPSESMELLELDNAVGQEDAETFIRKIMSV
ncbi:hypothetical protein FRB91_003990 [Serendipita sp. 411]|nr:hypothetical protein FRB91_003990 [Serendipita sp. 411]